MVFIPQDISIWQMIGGSILALLILWLLIIYMLK